MVKKIITLIVAITALFTYDVWAQTPPTPAATRLASLINAYRNELGLPTIPVSPALTRVAEVHAQDLESSSRSEQCNMHSWSSAGDWSACCYTADHAQARCMWAKPRELTQGAYRGNGYEIAHRHSGAVTPESALSGWRSSRGHHEVMINKGIWSKIEWQAMGVAISDHYALVWFGEVSDDVSAP